MTAPKPDGTTTSADAPRWLSDEEQRVWRRWLYVTNRMPAVLNAQLSEDVGISLQDFSVLVGLSEAPGRRARIAPLAEALQWERSRLSHQVARMAKRGLVAREECGDDARGSWVVLTPEGLAQLEAAAPRHVRGVRAHLFDLLDEDGLAALDRLTTAMRRSLEDA